MSAGTNIQSIKFNNTIQPKVQTNFKAQTAPVPDYPPDTVEINGKKKTGMSNGAKVGIGLGILGTAALAIGLIMKGRGSQAKEVVKHIDFKEAKTIEEAQKFAKDKLGVMYHDIHDLEVINFINEWITKVHNKCSIIDKTSYPKFVASSNEKQITAPFLMTSSVKANKNFEGHILGVNMKTFNNFDEFLNSVICDGSIITKNKNGKFIIVDNAYKTDFVNDVINRMNNYNTKTTFKDKLQLICDIQGISDGEVINGKLQEKVTSIYHNLNHELGHLRHQYSAKNYEAMKKVDEFKANNLPVSDITKEFLNTPTIQETAGKVSVYAQESPLEFVAETFADLIEGKTIPEDVMALYKKYNGPMI